MKNVFINLFFLPGILLLCAVGMLASLAGLGSPDRWCARQLTDRDSNEANGEPHLPKKS
jgi:hypothetical protein